MADGTTAKFIRRGLSRAATRWPGCQDEAPEAELLAVLDQGLGPTRVADKRTGHLKSPTRLQDSFKGGLDIPPTHVQFSLLRREHPIWTLDVP